MKMAQPDILLCATLAMLVLFVLEFQQVSSACCHNTKETSTGRFCADGTSATPCCGHGGCNLFCCACDQGCRTGSFSRVKRSVEVAVKDTGHFERFDGNGDGHHDIHESFHMFISGGCGENSTETVLDFKPIFFKYDKDGNGKLSWDEINEK